MLFALVGFASLSIGDGIIKSIAGEWPGTAVAALRYSFGAIGLATILFLKEGRAGFRLPMWKAQVARGFFVAMATVCFFSAIFLMPLAEATAIQFTSPMLTGLLSALLLKERASKRIWIATVVAFAGVLGEEWGVMHCGIAANSREIAVNTRKITISYYGYLYTFLGPIVTRGSISTL